VNELYVIDTHTLLWYLDDDSRLGYKAGQILDDDTARLLLPSIVLAEALFLLENKPYLYKLSIGELLANIADDARITIVALGLDVVVKTLDCQSIPEMHDRQIVATALLAQTVGVQVAILTKDENIQTSGLVQTLW
jgi:PIN domain nuclease of toxin-antitoxin system